MNYGAYTILPDGKKKYLPLKYYTNETILPERWDTKGCGKNCGKKKSSFIYFLFTKTIYKTLKSQI